MAQTNDSLVLNIKEKYLSVCCRADKNRTNILGVIRVKQAFVGVSLQAYFDCNLGIVPTCEDGLLEVSYKPNTIKINNDELCLGNSINGTDIDLYMPMKLISLEAQECHFIVLEIYNVSYTTVGGGYVYVIMILDSNKKMLSHHIHASGSSLLKQDIISILHK